MNRRLFVSLGLVCAVLGWSGCSKNEEKSAAGAQGNGPAAPKSADAGKPPAPKAPVKPQGPLQSVTGTRTARLEVNPTGRFFITVLAANRRDPEPIDAKELDCSLMRAGTNEGLKLTPKPLDTEKDGKCSRYTGFSKLLLDGKPIEVVVKFPEGEKKMASFKVPENYKSY